MGWKEKWEEFRESFAHPGKEEEGLSEEERRALHERREAALHGTDQSTGSETLDD
jgi:hypothetical protein